jgi:hypothetical protein
VQPGFQGGDYSIPGVPQGIDPRTSGAAAFLGGNSMLEGIQKNQELQQQQRDAAIKGQQLKAQGPLNVFDAVANSPHPAAMAMNNPSIMALWPKVAQQMGLDPVKDFNDQNVGRAAIFGGNQVRAAVGIPLRDMPVQQQITYGPNGQILSQNPQTNEVKQDVAPQDLKEVVGADGQPVYQPSGKAAGMRPFNTQLYGADSLSDQSKELAYQRFVATGEVPSSGRGGAIQQAVLMNYIAQRAQADGNPGAATAARAQTHIAQQGVLNDYTSGQTSKTLGSINTAVTHMAALDPLIDQLDNTSSPAWNTAANFFSHQTGSSAPTNFAGIKEFVGGEVAKAVLPGGGGEAERQALLAPLNAANSTAQLKQAVQQIETALAGKTEALRNQWDIGTNGTQGAFDKFLLPETKKALGLPGATPSASPSGSNGSNSSNSSNSSNGANGASGGNGSNRANGAGQVSHPANIQALLDKYKGAAQ